MNLKSKKDKLKNVFGQCDKFVVFGGRTVGVLILKASRVCKTG